MAYKDLKKALYNRLPETTQVTKTLLQDHTQDLTLNPVYRGPVYDPIGIQRNIAVRRNMAAQAAKKAYEEAKKEADKQRAEAKRKAAQSNSLADVVWDMLKFWDDDIPVLSPIGKWFYSWYDAAWDKEDGFTGGELGLRFLSEIVEDMDVLANPIKGLVLEGTTGLRNATFGDKDGIRHNYEIDLVKDSGWDFVPSMLLEVLLDPLTYVTYGASGAAKGFLSKTFSTIAEEAAVVGGRHLLKESTEHIAARTFKTVLKHAIKTNGDEIAEKLVRNVADNLIARSTDDVASTIYKNLADGILKNSDDILQQSAKQSKQAILRSFGESYKPIQIANKKAISIAEQKAKALAEEAYKFALKKGAKNFVKNFDEISTAFRNAYYRLGRLKYDVSKDAIDTIMTKVIKETKQHLLDDTSLTILKYVSPTLKHISLLDNYVTRTALTVGGGIYPAFKLLKKIGPAVEFSKIVQEIINKRLQEAITTGYTWYRNGSDAKEALELMAKHFDGDVTLKKLVEKLGADNIDYITFNKLYQYTMKETINNFTSIILKASADDGVNALSVINTYIKKTYDYESFDELIQALKPWTEAMDSSTKNAYGSLKNLYYYALVENQIAQLKVAKAQIKDGILEPVNTMLKHFGVASDAVTPNIDAIMSAQATDDIWAMVHRSMQRGTAAKDTKKAVRQYLERYLPTVEDLAKHFGEKAAEQQQLLHEVMTDYVHQAVLHVYAVAAEKRTKKMFAEALTPAFNKVFREQIRPLTARGQQMLRIIESSVNPKEFLKQTINQLDTVSAKAGHIAAALTELEAVTFHANKEQLASYFEANTTNLERIIKARLDGVQFTEDFIRQQAITDDIYAPTDTSIKVKRLYDKDGNKAILPNRKAYKKARLKNAYKKYGFTPYNGRLKTSPSEYVNQSRQVVEAVAFTPKARDAAEKRFHVVAKQYHIDEIINSLQNSKAVTQEELLVEEALIDYWDTVDTFNADFETIVNAYKASGELDIFSYEFLQCVKSAQVLYELYEQYTPDFINESLVQYFKPFIDLYEAQLLTNSTVKILQTKTEQCLNVFELFTYGSTNGIVSSIYQITKGININGKAAGTFATLRNIIEKLEPIINNEGLSETTSELGQMLTGLTATPDTLKEFYTHAKAFQDYAYKAMAFIEATQALYALSTGTAPILGQQELTAVLSTLMGMGQFTKCSTILNGGFENWYNSVFLPKVHRYINSAYDHKRALNQAAFFKKYQETGVLSKYGIDTTTYEHRALSDADVTDTIRREELSDDFQNYIKTNKLENHQLVVFDIEAAGLIDEGPYSPEIYEVGYRRYANVNDETPIEKIDLYRSFGNEVGAHIPERSTLDTLYPPTEHTYAQQLEAFKKEFGDLTAHPTPITDENEYFTKLLTDLFKDGDNIILNSHNGKAFDMPALTRRMRIAGVSEDLVAKFEALPHYDNYVALQRVDGYVALSDVQNEKIKEVLTQYLESNVMWSHVDDRFFDSGLRGLYRNCNNILAGQGDRIVPMDDLMSLKAFSQTLRNALESIKDTQGLRSVPKQYYIDINVVKTLWYNDDKTFKSFEDLLLPENYNALKSLTSLARATDLIGAKDKLTKEAYLLLQGQIGTDPNLTTILTLTSDKRDTYFNYFGYRTVYDQAATKRWFSNIPSEFNMAKEYYAEAKRLNYIVERARRNPWLEDSTLLPELKAFVTDMSNRLSEQSPESLVAKLSTDSENIYELYALARTYFNLKTLDGKKALLAAEDNTTYERVLAMLNYERFSTRHKDYTIASERIVDDYNCCLNTAYNTSDTLDKIIEIDNLADYNIETGARKIYNAEQQFQISALRDTVDMVKSARKLYDGTDAEAAEAVDAIRTTINQEVYQQETVASLLRDPEDIFEWLTDHKVAYTAFDDTPEYAGLKAHLLKNETALNKAGLILHTEDGVNYIVLNKDIKVDYYVDNNGFHKVITRPDGTAADTLIDYNKYSLLSLSSERPEFGEVLSKAHKVQERMAMLTNGASAGHLGKLLTKEDVLAYYRTLPTSVRKLLPDTAELTKSTRFLGHTFDVINLGSPTGRLARNPYYSPDYIRVLAQNSEKVVYTANQKNLMLDFWFNKDLSLQQLIDTHGLDKTYKLLADHKEFVVTYIAQNPKYIGRVGFQKQGYVVKQVSFNSPKQLKNFIASRPDAIVVPKHMYSELYSSLNSSLLVQNPLYRTAHKFIYLYKLGYLHTIGKFARDVLVEAPLKNAIETQNLLATVKNTYRATRDLKAYKQAVADILQLSLFDYEKLVNVGINPEEFAIKYINNRSSAEQMILEFWDSITDITKMDSSAHFLESNKTLYFKALAERQGKHLSEEAFDTLHSLLLDGGSLGQLDVWSNFVQSKHIAKQTQFKTDYEAGRIGNKMITPTKSGVRKTYDSAVHMLELPLTPAKYMDQVNRIAEYLTLVETCHFTPTEAIGKVITTHFDGAVKTASENAIELVVPFYTFFKRNALYWATACEKNPRLLKLFTEYIERTQGDLDSYSDFELEHNKSLQSAILNGSFAIGETETGDTLNLKINPPFMAAFQLATNPVATLLTSSNPVVQLIYNKFVVNNPKVARSIVEFTGGYRHHEFEEKGTKTPFAYSTLVPGVGSDIARIGPDGYAHAAAGTSKSELLRIVPSVFGRTKRFDEYTPWYDKVDWEGWKQGVESYQNKPQYRATVSKAQYKYLTGGYGKQSFKNYYKTSKNYYNTYRNYYPKRYTDYTYNNDTYRFYQKTWEQLRRERDYRNRVMYYKNIERQAQANKHQWRAKQVAKKTLKLPKYMKTFGKTIGYRP